MMKARAALLSLILAAFLPTALLGQSELTILGFDGRPVRVVQASYGDLFPVGTETEPRNPVLALGFEDPNRSTEYLLVPGTEGPDEENEIRLVFNKASDALFVFWESRDDDAAELRLVRLGTDLGWSEVLTISDNPLSSDAQPRLWVTQDTARFESAEGGATLEHRTLLHLVWSEVGPAGDRAVYRAMVLQEGSFGAGSNFELSEVAPEPLEHSVDPSLSLISSPAVTRGRDERSATLVFVDPVSRALVTAEISALPQELQQLAGGARPHITIVGHRMPRPRLADEMHDYVLSSSVSGSFHSAALDYIADRVRNTVLELGDPLSEPDLTELGNRVWEEILRAGASFGTRGLAGSSEKESTLLAVGGESRDTPEAVHALEVRAVAVFPVPETDDAPTRLFVSPDGQSVVVAWLVERELLFREWEGEAWSDVQRLQLDDGLTLPGAYDLLERRVQ